ncbi:hypothetical protein CUC08_Gglean013284 [Alternaria sp. MG1]|nr:hypothetical protein CUC08_Gglean013284 [Alternaria sp. MG1]
MGEIYSSCKSVYIWLGIPQTEVETHSEKGNRPPETPINPFTLALHFANDRHMHELPCFEFSKGQWSFVPSPLFQELWLLHKEVTTQAWWSRLWCVQEAILSPSAMVVFGRWRIPLSILKAAEMSHAYHVSSCCTQITALFPTVEHLVRSDQLLWIRQQDAKNTDTSPRKVFSDIDKVFRTFRYKLCQNPRDRIYGLLGLLDPNMQPRIVPDYTRSIGQTFLDAMEVLTAHSRGDLRYLTGSGFCSQEHGLPSWVRNFAASISQEATYEEVIRYEAYDLYNAAASTRADPKCMYDSILSLIGIRVDKITEIGLPVLGDNEDSSWRVLFSWSKMFKRADSPGRSTPDAMDIGAFWRVVLADTMLVDKPKCRRLTAEDVPRTNISWDDSRVPHFVSGPRRSMERSLQATTYGRSMFLTEGGRIGLCLPECRVGDEVWVLHGGKVPFVLRLSDRPTTKGRSGETIRSHRFIGDVYLRGIMDGEAMGGSSYTTREVLLL